jgi:predicted ATP-grasp superfamily ATP-dependent carboligase
MKPATEPKKSSLQRFIKNTGHSDLCIVIGLNNTTALSVIRDLGINGVKILGLCNNAISLGKFSRYCHYFVKYENEAELLKTLVSLKTDIDEKIPILVSTDPLVVFLEKNKKILANKYNFYWQKKNKLSDLINKQKMTQYALEAGLDVPKTYFSSETPLDVIERDITFPSVIKPLYTKDKIKAILVQSSSDLNSALDNDLFSDGFIVQELIEGSESNIFLSGSYSDQEGRLVANACGRKKRQLPKNFGFATAAVSINSAEVRQLSEKFTRYLKYFGPSDIEFKWSERDSKFYFIEINPRFPGFNQLFTTSGCHLAYTCYLGLKHNSNMEIKFDFFDKETRYISLLFDLITVLQNYSKITIFVWLRYVLSCKSFAVASGKDPLPFVIDLLCKISNRLRKIV